MMLALWSVSAEAASWTGIDLPDVTGSYKVGTAVIGLTDKDRKGVYADGSTSEFRKLEAQIWYPAQDSEAKAKPPYLDKAVMQDILQQDGNMGLTMDSRYLVRVRAQSNAPAAAGAPFPVLIFSPGFGTTYSFYQSILEDIASHGYIVIAVNSPNVACLSGIDGHSFHKLPSLKSEEEAETYFNVHFQETVDDLKFVAKQLPSINSNAALPVAGRLDIHNIGCFGHSYGGAAAIEAAGEDPQISAGADIDGSLYSHLTEDRMHTPMLLMGSEKNFAADPTWKPFIKGMPKGSMQIRVKGAAHNNFSDVMLLQSSLAGDAGGEKKALTYIRITRAGLLSFFDEHVKHGSDAETEKMKSEFPGLVHIYRTK